MVKHLSTLLVLFSILGPCCAQTGRETKVFEDERRDIALTNYYIALNLHSLLDRYTEKVAWTVDSLTQTETDQEIRQNLRLLKYNLVNVLAKTSFHADPLAGALDSWVLGYQLSNYFGQPACPARYGHHCEDLRALFRQYTQAYEKGLDAYIPDSLTVKAQQFARNHPIENTQLGRASVIPRLSAWLSEDELRIKSSLFTMTDLLRDLTFRMEYYAEMLPKQTQWQIEHELGAILPEDSLSAVVRDAHELLRLTTQTLAKTEALINANRDTLLYTIDYQRTASFRELRRERIAAFETLAQERALILEAVRLEREALQAFIEAQRIATMADAQVLTSEALLDTKEIGKELIDYVFLRVLLLMLLSGIIVAILVWFYRKRQVKTQ